MCTLVLFFKIIHHQVFTELVKHVRNVALSPFQFLTTMSSTSFNIYVIGLGTHCFLGQLWVGGCVGDAVGHGYVSLDTFVNVHSSYINEEKI